MASFEQHCNDCERLLGLCYEEVNHWMDEYFRTHGPYHRQFRHHWDGVKQVHKLYGRDWAKAVIIHIVRDCGGVPNKSDYRSAVMVFIRPPEELMYDGTEKAAVKFQAVVEEEWQKLMKEF